MPTIHVEIEHENPGIAVLEVVIPGARRLLSMQGAISCGPLPGYSARPDVERQALVYFSNNADPKTAASIKSVGPVQPAVFAVTDGPARFYAVNFKVTTQGVVIPVDWRGEVPLTNGVFLIVLDIGTYELEQEKILPDDAPDTEIQVLVEYE